MSFNRPTALIVLDGFGIAPANNTNAVSLSEKPFFDSLIKTYPSMLLEASGLSVGLPRGEVGNSEVGHLTIGSGILRYQSLPRIDKSISTGHFFKLPEMIDIEERVKKTGCKLHIMGLIGNGGVHSSQEHLEALVTFCKKTKIWKNTFLHTFLDGRDTSRDVGKVFMESLIDYCEGEDHIASIGGRYFAMDRNKNWDRIEKAYNSIVNAKSEKTSDDPIKLIEESYGKEIYDEEFEPTVMLNKKGEPVTTVEDGDIVLFFNFRADRGKQMTQALSVKGFDKFKVKEMPNLKVVTFAEYSKDLPADVLFAPEIVKNPMAKVVSSYNLTQLHVAETEKYAHVTFFLNGMQEDKFAGEERLLIPSPSVATYDEKPDMSAVEITKGILKSLKEDKTDFYCVNYANPDMVGHTGNLDATVKGIQTMDACLNKVVTEIVKRGGQVFIVSDHGNSEEMINLSTGEIDKEHNIYPVPFIAVGNKFRDQGNAEIYKGDMSSLTPVGILADVAPTILTQMDLELPPEMTGMNLF